MSPFGGVLRRAALPTMLLAGLLMAARGVATIAWPAAGDPIEAVVTARRVTADVHEVMIGSSTSRRLFGRSARFDAHVQARLADGRVVDAAGTLAETAPTQVAVALERYAPGRRVTLWRVDDGLTLRPRAARADRIVGAFWLGAAALVTWFGLLVALVTRQGPQWLTRRLPSWVPAFAFLLPGLGLVALGLAGVAGPAMRWPRADLHRTAFDLAPVQHALGPDLRFATPEARDLLQMPDVLQVAAWEYAGARYAADWVAIQSASDLESCPTPPAVCRVRVNPENPLDVALDVSYARYWVFVLAGLGCLFVFVQMMRNARPVGP